MSEKEQTKINGLLGDRVLLRQSEKTDSIGVLALSDDAKQEKHTGTIIMLGTKISESQLEIGSTVLYDKFAVTRISVSGEDFLIVPTNNIILIL